MSEALCGQTARAGAAAPRDRAAVRTADSSVLVLVAVFGLGRILADIAAQPAPTPGWIAFGHSDSGRLRIIYGLRPGSYVHSGLRGPRRAHLTLCVGGGGVGGEAAERPPAAPSSGGGALRAGSCSPSHASADREQAAPPPAVRTGIRRAPAPGRILRTVPRQAQPCHLELATGDLARPRPARSYSSSSDSHSLTSRPPAECRLPPSAGRPGRGDQEDRV